MKCPGATATSNYGWDSILAIDATNTYIHSHGHSKVRNLTGRRAR